MTRKKNPLDRSQRTLLAALLGLALLLVSILAYAQFNALQSFHRVEQLQQND